MAVSVFKSTTKRECAIGAQNESDNAYSGVVPFQPSTPVNKRRVHKRTQSLSDFSADRLTGGSSDANSRHLDSLFLQGKRASSRFQSDCDSESDADSVYSRPTYRSVQNAEMGASRKAALHSNQRTAKTPDKRRSPSVERSYKEVAEFLSLLDDPNDADAEAPPSRPSGSRRFDAHERDPQSVFPRLSQPPSRVRADGVEPKGETESLYSHFARARRTLDAQSDTEDVFSRLSQPRRRTDAQSDTEEVFTRLSFPRRRNDAQSDTEEVFSRLTQPRRRSDSQSDTENVFSRLTRPRQSLGPPRSGPNAQNSQRGENGKGKGIRAGVLRRSTSQLDVSSALRGRDNDHSDTESLYSSRNNRSIRQTPSFGQASSVAPRKRGTRTGALRRPASTQIDFSDTASLDGFMLPASHVPDDDDTPDEAFFEAFICKQQMEHDFPPREEDAPSGHPEEEKTIRAVHTQNKEPRGQDLDAISLYDAMRAEMRKAVSEIRSEIEQKSVSKDLVLATPSLEEDHCISPAKEDEEEETSVSEVRREYSAKLEQSEKRAQDLWTQLAAEERRCLDLVKFVKELLPAQGGATLQPRLAPPPPPPMRPIMGPEVEQQLVSQCLDADAQRYFDECISLAGLDITSVNDASSCGAGYQDGLDIMSVNDAGSCGAGAGYQESEGGWSVRDMPISPRKRGFSRSDERNVLVLQHLKLFCSEMVQRGQWVGAPSKFFPKVPVNEDGLFLPWLQWDTDPDTASSSGSKEVCGRCVTSSDQASDEQDTQPFNLPPGVSGLGCFGSSDLSSWGNLNFGHLSHGDGSVLPEVSGLGRFRNSELSIWKNVDFGHSRHVDARQGVDVEMFVLRRPRMRHGIVGRIRISGGIRW